MESKTSRFIAYYRVSTDRQGRSGLGLEAQRDAVQRHLTGVRGTLITEYVEIESGKRNDRPELQRALAACRRNKAKLVIAKLDRLSRNVAFIASLMDSGVEFLCCDNPTATRLTLHILAAVAEHEREMIAARTKAALLAAKARGVQLGRNGAERLAPANKAAAIERAEQLRSTLSDLTASGMSARQIATELIQRGVPTPRGGRWHPTAVGRIRNRLSQSMASAPQKILPRAQASEWDRTRQNAALRHVD